MLGESSRTRVAIWMALAAPVAACDPGSSGPGRRDTGGVIRLDTQAPRPCRPTVDSDGDGAPDDIEGSGDADMDGTPNMSDPDSNGDGMPDSAQRGSDPCRPTDTDGNGVADFLEPDLDNDGIPNWTEIERGTNPLSRDTDGDGVEDAVEESAGTSPTDAGSRPPASALYVVLPFMGTAQREFDFSTRLRAADICFVVDTTGSMATTITTVQNTLQSTIVPGIAAALGPMGNARYGMTAHGDFREGDINRGSPPNRFGSMTVLQRLTTDVAAVQASTSRLTAEGGGDGPESQVSAMHSLISGFGTPNYGGTATRPMNPSTDCGRGPDDPESFGWCCFQDGRVPIVVLFSDAPWNNGPTTGDGSRWFDFTDPVTARPTPNRYASTPSAATYAQLEAEMVRRGAYFVGIDVSPTAWDTAASRMYGGQTLEASRSLARATGTMDGSGNPIAFRGAANTVATQVINAITNIAGTTRQDITTRVEPDATETRLPSGRTTADFFESIVPLRGTPDAPAGFDRMDMTTFYNVDPATIVTFQPNFRNDFYPGGRLPEVFRATIQVLGRARSVVDTRQVFMVVPPAGGTYRPPV